MIIIGQGVQKGFDNIDRCIEFCDVFGNEDINR